MSVQTFLTIGALALLALTSLRFNSVALENTTVEVENKVYLTAFSLADDLIEEIKQKAFDAATVNFPTTNPKSLTPYYSLGPSSTEKYPYYNDVDDFNNFIREVDAPHVENYSVSCKVFYVDGDNPDIQTNYQTFYKKAEVTVSSEYMRGDIKLSFIFTLK